MGPSRTLPGLPTGNDSTRPTPFGARGRDPYGYNNPPAAQMPGAAGTVPGVGRPRADYEFFQINGVYRATQRNTFQIPFGQTETVLIEPPDKRVFLQLRSARASTLVCNIGFNTPCPDGSVADFELLPGEAVAFDFFVPQNRIYASAVPAGAELTGDVHLIVTYSNVLPNMQG